MPMKTRSKTDFISKIEVASIIASISKTDKNNKLKKRKIQQTLDRKVNRSLKTLPFHDIEEQEQQEQEQEKIVVNKLEETNIKDSEGITLSVEAEKDSYKKMNLPALRSFIISK